MKLLIDADVLIHRATKAVEREEIFGDHHVLFSSFEEARDKFHRLLSTLLADAEAAGWDPEAGHELYVSGSKNWRKDVWVGYKTNRKDRKPLAYARLKEYVLDLGANMSERLEADDLLGIDGAAGKGIITSVDKDFLTISCPFLRLSVDLKPMDLIHNTVPQARWHHLYQTLAGDSTDGYKGCPKYGPKTSARFLDDHLRVAGEVQDDELAVIWDDIVAVFEEAGEDEVTAMLNATMAHIMHADENDPRPWLISTEDGVLCSTP